MIRAILYASLVCAVMTLGLVAFATEQKVSGKAQVLPQTGEEVSQEVEQQEKESLAHKQSAPKNKPVQISITASIEGVRNKRGQIIAQLYDNPDAFNNNRYEQALRTIITPAQNFKGELHFDDVKSGSYAVVLFHDENNNQHFDQSSTSIEGYAYSNNTGKNAPATFKQAVFHAEENKRFTIRMIYH